MDFEAWSTENGVRSIEYLSRSMEYRVWKIGYGIWTMAYGILNMEYGMWNVECGMDSAGDCCSKISRCIFDAQGIGDIWDADRIEGRALARPEDSSIYIYIYMYIYVHLPSAFPPPCLTTCIVTTVSNHGTVAGRPKASGSK